MADFVRYDNQDYKIEPGDVAAVKQAVLDQLNSGKPGWLDLREESGAGALLLISPGVNITLVSVPAIPPSMPQRIR